MASIADVEYLQSIRVPWLVPACQRPDRSSQWYVPFFRQLSIAALVPGASGSRCDVSAYKWPCEDANADPCFQFVVKARSGSYSIQEGIRDLIRKCEDHDETRGCYHAMLIGVRQQLQTEVKFWRVEKSGKHYLRIVIVIATRQLLKKQGS